ncbi:DUF192 domain-containing protein [Donghicola sp. C2-DW-16]|uniref:DUF192 domain-containing protein n=1 Tax=Donghicola mangrovi TaxID=2729614 RepID=A0A850QCN1_9RHOB|nr:DUF192 domain-containing protein [Donghicola mangrovi]NVO23641.1 DUF192 domain-containing protein [Donghicola mangrovi]NVO26902.1 DUF192 domain-containing protein [Donghicola mangrovi]
MKNLGWAVFLSVLAGPLFAECSDSRVNLRGDWGTASFSIEIADDDAERSLGLMHREHMPSSHGMLFVYDRAQPVSFWMRNTLIPLDLLYVDATGTVQEVHENARPLDETPIRSTGPRLAVLEINGGLSHAMGITVGTQLQHSAFGAEAAWPCSAK